MKTKTPSSPHHELAPKSLAEALALIGEARAQRDRASAALVAEKAEHQRTKDLLNATRIASEAARVELAAIPQKLVQMRAETAAERAAHVQTTATLERAERGLGVRGVSAAEAIPALLPPAASASTEDYERRIQNARTPAERQAIAAEYVAAVNAGTIGKP